MARSHYDKQAAAGYRFMAKHMNNGSAALELEYEDVDDSGYAVQPDTDASAEITRLNERIKLLERTLASAGRMYNGRPVITVAEAAEWMGVDRSSVFRRMQPSAKQRIEGYQASNRQWWVYADQALSKARRGRPKNTQPVAN